MAQVAVRPQVPVELAPITLVDAEDRAYRLGELWADGPVVLIHLRHFGCILCRHYAGALRDFYGDFEARGARLVAIGTGGREYAREFIDEREIPYLILVDEHMATHAIVGAGQGRLWDILRPRNLWAVIKAMFAGQGQGKAGPNPYKYGAAHVIGPGGELRYAWVNDDYHDNAPVQALLDVVGSSSRQLGDAQSTS